MCGLIGFTAPHDDARRDAEAMLEMIAYRGPDERGFHIDSHMAIGHLRLTIIDPKGGHQPRFDPKTGDLLAFNGEIYGYKALADELRREGAPLRDNSDTEVLFWLLRRDGIEKTLTRIEGMFAFAYRDGNTNTVYLVRDRFGEKPLYYSHRQGQLIFGSELKAVRRHPTFNSLDFDPIALSQYLTFEFVPAPRTLFEGILKLDAGHVLTFSDGRLDVRPYWRPTIGEPSPLKLPLPSEAQAIQRLKALLTASVKDRLVADVPVGIFLSGGVDSGLLAALAARHNPGITAYTVRMSERSYDETPYAKRIAAHIGIRHEIISLGEQDLLSALDGVEQEIDEPFADNSLVPTYLLCRTARGHVKVALGGDGADELFAGYPNFYVRPYARAMSMIRGGLSRGLRAAISRLPVSTGYMSLNFKLAQLAKGFGEDPDLQSFCWMAPFSEDEKNMLVSAASRMVINADDTFEPVYRKLLEQNLSDPVERLIFLFSVIYLPDNILFKIDRASMYHSLEVRAPYLDTAFAEYAMALPLAFKVRGRTTKSILKKLACEYLPRDVVSRPKHGFSFDISTYLRGPLRERTSATIFNAGNPLADWFSHDVLERIWHEHMTARRDHRKKLWALYMLFRAVERYA